MTNCVWYLICILAGLILGIIFFILLRWKVEMITKHNNSHLCILYDITRFGLLMICFYLLSGHYWQNWVACLVGWTSLKLLILFRVLHKLDSTTGSATL